MNDDYDTMLIYVSLLYVSHTHKILVIKNKIKPIKQSLDTKNIAYGSIEPPLKNIYIPNKTK